METERKLVEIDEQAAILFFYQDIVNLIQKAKELRWDIVKWGVTLNLAVAALPTAVGAEKSGVLIVLIGAITVIAVGLYVQTQRRLAAYRGRVLARLYRNCGDRFRALAGDIYQSAHLNVPERLSQKRQLEWKENTLFLSAIIISCIAAIIAVFAIDAIELIGALRSLLMET